MFSVSRSPYPLKRLYDACATGWFNLPHHQSICSCAIVHTGRCVLLQTSYLKRKRIVYYLLGSTHFAYAGPSVPLRVSAVHRLAISGVMLIGLPRKDYMAGCRWTLRNIPTKRCQCDKLLHLYQEYRMIGRRAIRCAYLFTLTARLGMF